MRQEVENIQHAVVKREKQGNSQVEPTHRQRDRQNVGSSLKLPLPDQCSWFPGLHLIANLSLACPTCIVGQGCTWSIIYDKVLDTGVLLFWKNSELTKRGHWRCSSEGDCTWGRTRCSTWLYRFSIALSLAMTDSSNLIMKVVPLYQWAVTLAGCSGTKHKKKGKGCLEWRQTYVLLATIVSLAKVLMAGLCIA